MQTQTEHSTTSTTHHAATKQAPRHGARLAKLRAYIDGGKLLLDRDRPLTPDNLKPHWDIARAIGYLSDRSVGRVIRREFPSIAAMYIERRQNPDQPAPKKKKLLRYIAEGRHLRSPEDDLSVDNLKTQQEIADEVGMKQQNVSYYLQEYFPAIAAVMANRRRYDREE
ncbi:hypothetical protein [Ralstonia solanacearum]|uniref:hypothetical protein n=1 Tax=Ralstonia solanacearum TaxID=305 RepID=UPI0018D0137A|nr:hypothetical protein [Ralstonia solanacearum]